MINLNRVIIAGNLVKDPTLHETASGKKFTRLRISLPDMWTNSNGGLSKRAINLTIITWGSLAENCVKYLKKGKPVMCEGKLISDSYKDKQGVNHDIIRAQASSVTFLENNIKKD